MSAVTQCCADYFAPLYKSQPEPMQQVSQEVVSQVEDDCCYDTTAWKVASYFLIVIPFVVAIVWGFSAFIDWATEAIEEATDPLARRVPVDYIGEDEWTTYLDVDQTRLFFGRFPRLSCEEIRDLRTLFDRREANTAGENAKIRDNMGITILEIPRGVTPNMLIQRLETVMGIRLGGTSHQGNHVHGGTLSGRVLSQIGDVPTLKPYRVAITNSDIMTCNHASFSAQKDFLAGIGLEHPILVEMLALLFFRERLSLGPTYQSLGLYGIPSGMKWNSPSMVACCAEQVDKVPVLFNYLPATKELGVFTTSSESSWISSGASKQV